jgi:hypothetical protein
MNLKSIFLLGCIPVRLLLVYLSTVVPGKVLSLPLVLIGLGFLFLYLTNGRMNPPESSTGKAWWSHLRIIHACLYLTAALLAFNESRFVWIPLTIDVVFGLLSFSIYHYY